MAAQQDGGGFETLNVLKSIEPPLWLSPSQDLSRKSRAASCHLFSRLNPFCPKSPFDRLLVDGFDVEQIWQQIDVQSQPLLSGLRREVRWFEKNPGEISNGFGEERVKLERQKEGVEMENEELGLETEGDGGEEFEDMEELHEDIDDDDDGEEEEEEEEEAEEEEKEGGGIEDKFLRIKELEEYLEEGEAKEHGLVKKKDGRKISSEREDLDEEDEDEDEDGDDVSSLIGSLFWK